MASVLVSNLGASSADEATLREFFSYSGVVSGVTLHDGANGARSATVSFASKDALATALLLTGATSACRCLKEGSLLLEGGLAPSKGARTFI